MVFILVKHKVEDYSKWRKLYDGHKSSRIRSGMLSEKMFRGVNDPTEIYMLFKWDNIINAKIFYQSEDLKKTMENAGVMTMPETSFIEEAEQRESTKQVMQPFEVFS